MDWQTPEDAVFASFVSEANAKAIAGKPPVTGAWREGDPPADRQFASVGPMVLERGGELPSVRIAYETFGELDADRSNAILVAHALTGDSHVVGPAGPGQPTAGWWTGMVGSGAPLNTDRWFVVVPNMLGGCQGTTGPASHAPDGAEWGSRFPFVSIRDQVDAQALLADSLGIERWAAVIGGSMGGMQVLEWGVSRPDRVARLGVLAAPALSSADQIAANSVQVEAVRMDAAFNGGDYYDQDEGPFRGLALARRMALLGYRSPTELNDRFERSWQSGVSPLGGGGRYAVESYLDYHGNKFTRRFDANSYLRLVEAMSSHDIGRGRGGIAAALGTITARTLVLGIDSDRLYPVEDQRAVAALTPGNIDGDVPAVISSPFGHDAFLIEVQKVGAHLGRLLADART